jgi:hypothetical protein
VPSATLGGIGRWTSPDAAACNPETTSFTTCAFTTINLPAATQVLLIGAVKPQAEDAGGGVGQCALATNPGQFIIPASLSGFTVGGENYPNDRHVPLIALANPVGPGPVDFAIRCNEQSGKVFYFDSAVAPVALSPD